MARQVRVRSIKRKELDEDKLALAFLLLAKIIDEAEQAEVRGSGASTDPESP
jgi:hypothetical protein